MEATDESIHTPNDENLEEGYFICPICGEKDLEFFDEIFTCKINKEKYNRLTEEQKLYINKQRAYGILLCENCYNKIKRWDRVRRGLAIVGLFVLCNIPRSVISALSLFAIFFGFQVYFFKVIYPENIDFQHVWKCNAVRRTTC